MTSYIIFKQNKFLREFASDGQQCQDNHAVQYFQCVLNVLVEFLEMATFNMLRQPLKGLNL